MSTARWSWPLAAVLLAGCATLPPPVPMAPDAPRPPEARLLEPAEGDAPDGLPLVRDLPDTSPARASLEALLARPYITWVLELGALGRERAVHACVTRGEPEATCLARHDHPPLLVIQPKGNRPRRGLAIVGADGAVEPRPEWWYVEVDPRRAAKLVPHEYGHVILFELLGADPPDHPRGLPHTTGAITDDVVAFSEGWGIHFETLAGDRPEMGALHAALHRDRFRVDEDLRAGPSLASARDLLTFAQGFRRYSCIKENCFAALPRPPASLAAQPPDPDALLRAWTDTAVDPARLRTLEQMVASEGVLAALFYRLGTVGTPAAEVDEDGRRPLPDLARYRQLLDAVAAIRWDGPAPSVLEMLRHLLTEASEADRRLFARVLLEVFHYAGFVEGALPAHAEVHRLGRELRIHEARALLDTMAIARQEALDRLVREPDWLLQVCAPELWIEVPEVAVGFEIFGAPRPLALDLNTATVPFLMAFPGVDLAAASGLADHRARHGGLRSFDALAEVPGLDPDLVTALAAAARSP